MSNFSPAANKAAREQAAEYVDLLGKQSPRFWEHLAKIAAERAGSTPEGLAGKGERRSSVPASPPPAKVLALDALAYAAELGDEITDLADQVPEIDRAQEFAESARCTAADIGESIEAAGSATEKQIKALENIRNGLQKWVR